MYVLIADGIAGHFLTSGTLPHCYKLAARLHARLGMDCGIYRPDGTEIREQPRTIPLLCCEYREERELREFYEMEDALEAQRRYNPYL